jgi:Big-like domain-containing protein
MRHLLRAAGLDPAEFCPLMICAAFVSISWGCGGPSAPTPTPKPNVSPGPTSTLPVATVLSITIVPDVTTLTIGQAQRFSMSVELSPGFPPVGLAPVWSSTNAAVVTVDGSGEATAVSQGEATIQVSFLGTTATRHLQLVP